MKKIELLSPAGDLERLKIACLYGADAVYIGGPIFGLRANANNFTFEEIKEGCKFAHELGKKVHVTVNIALHNKELKYIKEYLKKLEECGIDAIIVSDPYIIDTALKETKIPVHLSTQASTLNYESVDFFEKQGVSRVVLGRETSKEEIKEILDKTNVEIECFIHGAMCSSYSGRCVLSNFFTNRDANRGGCAQICRWDFDLYGDDKNITSEKPFTFCTKDLSMINHIPEMIDMGISSLKIEGRMRSIYYIATVVSTYRKVIDSYYDDPNNYKYDQKLKKVLDAVANRDSIAQFFDGNYDESTQYYNGRMELSNQDFLGVVIDYNDKYAIIEQRNYFKKGDTIEIFGPNNCLTYKVDEIIDEDGNTIDVVRHPRQIVKIPIDFKVNKYDMLRIKR